MKRSITVAKSIIASAALLGSMALYAASMNMSTVEGRLNGLECASHGETCPTDKLDPHLASERDFVVQTSDGKYYFITNLDRAIKARHVLEMVQVKGEMSSRFNAITASELSVKKGGSYVKTWSVAMENEEFRRVRGLTPEGGGNQ